jgi:hypothetical protein
MEFDLLHTLAEHRGRVLSREQLLGKMWETTFFGVLRVVRYTPVYLLVAMLAESKAAWLTLVPAVRRVFDDGRQFSGWSRCDRVDCLPSISCACHPMLPQSLFC